MKNFKWIFVIINFFTFVKICLCTFGDFLPISVRREMKAKGLRDFDDFDIPDFLSMVRDYGYPAEEYKLITPDGYKLKIHRIPGSPKWPKSYGKPIVYIQHGILACSDMFILQGPGKDLAYLLVDAGYDVWIGNSRGSSYGRAHTILSPDRDPEFWDFSFHEMALTDMSETIDFILRQTGKTSLTYVAHSMGTTMGFILLSSKPEFNDKINLVINMATVGYWKNPGNLIKLFMLNGELVERFVKAAGINEILPQTVANSKIFNETCRDGSVLQNVCRSIIYIASGFNGDLLDFKLLLKAFKYYPSGASTKSLIHFYQNIMAGKLQMFDYGLTGNYARYKQLTPPIYNLSNIEIPVYLFYGKTDAIASPEDSFDMAKRLKNGHLERVPSKYFGHLDFIWTKNIRALLNDRIMEIIMNSTEFTRIRR